ncbi:hypothetical protein F4777DRAFT_582327 [Nemania sp. FL0916]|nr:hypothetical protein F4777DRAFT_582327 [Nemania sp. FL0916]
MASTRRIQLYFSSCLLFSLLVSSLTIPHDELRHQTALSLNDQSFLGTPPEVKAYADCPRKNPYVADGTLIDQLWKQNCDLVARFLNNNFTTWQAITNNPAATLPSFQYYSAQDYYYLLETVQHKAYLMPSWLPQGYKLNASINATVDDMKGDLAYAQDFFDDITKNLNISKTVIDQGGLQAAGLGYVKWLQASTSLGRDKGWGEIANQLNSSGTTQKNTIFYEKWISPNLDWSYGQKMSNEFQANLVFNNSLTFPAYNILFREGLRNEIAFFEGALGKTLNDNKQ